MTGISKYSFAIIISVLLLTELFSSSVLGASSDTKIKKIEVSPCINNIQQDPDNDSVYRVAINNSVTSVNVNIEPNNPKSSVEVQGNVGLDVGTNRVDITITAEDGNSESYVIYVRRLSKEIADTQITPNVQEEKQEFTKPDTEVQPADVETEENETTNEIVSNVVFDENTILGEENIIVEKLDNETAKWESNIINDNSKRRMFIIGVVISLIVIAIIIVVVRKNKYKSRH